MNVIPKDPNGILDVVARIPESASVLDIGGASAPIARADALIDIVDYDGVRFDHMRGAKARFSESTYTKFDICSREPWPYADKQFDYSICSHVLEDIRDPLWVCSEIMRVSKAGYIEVPSRDYEMTFGVEMRTLAGAAHHRWVIDTKDGKIRFTFKYMSIHEKNVNKRRVPFDRKHPSMFLCIEWKDTIEYFENWLNSGKEIIEFYAGHEITEQDRWNVIRKTSPDTFIVRWLKYLKHTSPFFEKLSKKIA